MQFKLPKNSEQFVWTNHSIDKMRQYGLSEQRVRSVLHTPKRKEEGIAPNTSAVMQATGTNKNPTEIWVMFQEVKSEKSKVKSEYNEFKNNLATRLRQDFGGQRKRRIISAWRYPGISPIRTVPEIPDEVWNILDGDDDIN